MTVLVTGGAGYIGSHTVLCLLEHGHDVVVLDNFCNGHTEALSRVRELSGRSFEVVECDIRDKSELVRAVESCACDSVIHFAGLKAVGESVSEPIKYYKNNVLGTINLLDAMQECGVKKIIFSSSATVYGDPKWLPITEDHPLVALNPYGRTKLIVENILRDLQKADTSWRIGILRYFNPVGAHPSGIIGEDPRSLPANLMPYISQVAVGRLPHLRIWGDDYPTRDGTGERDYIHVMDLSHGHVSALEKLNESSLFEVNLGTGESTSVLELAHRFSEVCGSDIPIERCNRREGDAATCYADVSRARSLLGWSAQYDLFDMCQDQWRWQSQNPKGYEN